MDLKRELILVIYQWAMGLFFEDPEFTIVLKVELQKVLILVIADMNLF